MTRSTRIFENNGIGVFPPWEGNDGGPTLSFISNDHPGRCAAGRSASPPTFKIKKAFVCFVLPSTRSRDMRFNPILGSSLEEHSAGLICAAGGTRSALVRAGRASGARRRIWEIRSAAKCARRRPDQQGLRAACLEAFRPVGDPGGRLDRFKPVGALYGDNSPRQSLN